MVCAFEAPLVTLFTVECKKEEHASLRMYVD